MCIQQNSLILGVAHLEIFVIVRDHVLLPMEMTVDGIFSVILFSISYSELYL